MVVRKFGVLSAGKVLGALYALLGLVVGAFTVLFSLLGAAIGAAGSTDGRAWRTAECSSALARSFSFRFSTAFWGLSAGYYRRFSTT